MSIEFIRAVFLASIEEMYKVAVKLAWTVRSMQFPSNALHSTDGSDDLNTLKRYFALSISSCLLSFSCKIIFNQVHRWNIRLRESGRHDGSSLSSSIPSVLEFAAFSTAAVDLIGNEYTKQ
jgi:hypothetical protein